MTAPVVFASSIFAAFPTTASLSYQSAFGQGNGNNSVTGLTPRFTNIQVAGTLNNLYVRVPTNTRTIASTVTIYNNGSATTLSASITGSTTGYFTDLSNSASLAIGDEIGWQYDQGTGAGATTVNSVCATFTPSSGTSQLLCSNIPTAVAIANTTPGFFALSGALVSASADSTVRMPMPIAGTLFGMNINVTANTWTTTTAVRSRKNTANGNQLITVTGGTTGIFTDVANSDSIAVNDLINTSITNAAGSGSFSVNALGATFTSTTDTQSAIRAQRFAGFSSTTRFPTFIGNSPAPGTTEAPAKSVLGLAGTIDLIGLYIFSNTSTSASTLALRVNGATVNGTVAIGIGSTGLIQDITGATDVVAATDDINYQFSGHNNTVNVMGTFARFVTAAIGGGGSFIPGWAYGATRSIGAVF